MNIKDTHLRAFVWVIIICSVATSAHAADLLTNVGDSYKTASAQWFPKLYEIAKSLFWKLAAIEFAWACVLWVLKTSDEQSFFASVVQKIIGIGFFYMVLTNATYWIPAIIHSLTQAGQKATGLTELTPSAVFDIGINTAVTMLNGVKGLSLWDDAGVVLIGSISGIFIVIAFLVMATQMLIALIESYIVMGGGIIFLGFGGSRWTTDFAQKYISYAFSTGVKIFVLYLIVGVGIDQAKTWSTLLNPLDFNAIFYVLGGSLLLGFIAFMIPSLASSMLSGSPSLSAGSGMGTMAGVAAGTVAAGAKTAGGGISAGSSAIQSAQGGMQAIGSAYSSNRASGMGKMASAALAPVMAGGAMAEQAGKSIAKGMGFSSGNQTGTLGGRAAQSMQQHTAKAQETNAGKKSGSSPSSGGTSSSGSSSSSSAHSGSAPEGGSSKGSSSSTSSSGSDTGGVSSSHGETPSPPPPSGGKNPSGDDSTTSSQNASTTGSSSSSTAAQVSAAPNANATSQSSGNYSSSSSAPQEHSEKPKQKPLENLRRVRAPQIPHDAAPPVSINIKLGHSED